MDRLLKVERPFPAYKGDEPYIFVSYSHSNSSAVFPELIWLKECGFNIWYDEGCARHWLMISALLNISAKNGQEDHLRINAPGWMGLAWARFSRLDARRAYRQGATTR